jgi:hypothetical protein
VLPSSWYVVPDVLAALAEVVPVVPVVVEAVGADVLAEAGLAFVRMKRAALELELLLGAPAALLI